MAAGVRRRCSRAPRMRDIAGETTKPPADRGLFGGRCRTRTDDLFRVKEARYQLRQSPASRTGLIDRTGCRGVLPTTGRAASRDTRGARPVLHRRSDQVMSYECSGQAPGTKCGCSAVVAHHLAKVRVASSNLVIRSSEEVFVRETDGRSRHVGRTTHGGVAERLGTGLQSRLHGFESRRHLAHNRTACIGAIGAAVARFPDTEEVTGSIPVSRTAQYRRKPPDSRGFFALGQRVPENLSSRRIGIPLDECAPRAAGRHRRRTGVHASGGVPDDARRSPSAAECPSLPS